MYLVTGLVFLQFRIRFRSRQLYSHAKCLKLSKFLSICCNILVAIIGFGMFFYEMLDENL